MISKIGLKGKIKFFGDKPWSPVEVARLGGNVLRMALFHGEYHWHKHRNEDELFYVYRGSVIVQLKDQSDIKLNAGEMVVIPKGTEHCPKSFERSYVLLLQPSTLNVKGD
jgi:mannose-6-phosphate isomerase-like protein (cupin superfamily)